MIANWMEGCLILSPESDEDEQVLIALSEACPIMRWTRSPGEGTMETPKRFPNEAVGSVARADIAAIIAKIPANCEVSYGIERAGKDAENAQPMQPGMVPELCEEWTLTVYVRQARPRSGFTS